MVPSEVSLACSPVETTSRDVLFPVLALSPHTCFPACPQLGLWTVWQKLLEELASNKGNCGAVHDAV